MMRLRHDERLAEGVVEADGDVACELHVLLLVLAHRHRVGLVEQDVGGLQHRVVEQRHADALALLPGGLVLELRHAPQLAHVGDGVEQPHHLAVGRHVALHEQDGALRIDARGEQQVDQVDGVAPQLGAHLAHGDGVQVDGAVDAVVRLLHVRPSCARRPGSCPGAWCPDGWMPLNTRGRRSGFASWAAGVSAVSLTGVESTEGAGGGATRQPPAPGVATGRQCWHLPGATRNGRVRVTAVTRDRG